MFKHLISWFRRPSKWRLRKLLTEVERERFLLGQKLKVRDGELEAWKEAANRSAWQYKQCSESKRALRAKIATYENSVQYAIRALRKTKYKYVAESLKRAYDAPIK